jgi:2-polyprenyl-3-methyl-5-hydroxy-6-metoxy-1,4-benzoquinol methylase
VFRIERRHHPPTLTAGVIRWPVMDRAKISAFMERFEELAAGAAGIGVLAVADRAGLLQALSGRGPVKPSDLADDFDERMVREILSALAAAGVVEYDEGRFTLPDEHAACLADPDSPYLLAGWLDTIPAVMNTIDAVMRATIEGGGVALSAFDDRVVAGIDRLNSPGTRILLTRRWLSAMPDVISRLERGARIADVGCGGGTAALTMATAYPNSTVVGYDVDRRALDKASDRAREAGLSNLSFERVEAEDLPSGFDLITTFDVIHDLSRPAEALAQIRRALAPGGVYFMMEPAAGPQLEDNLNTRGLLNLSVSVLYCLPQSLVDGGAGLGTAWGPRRAEELCRRVGFTHFERLPIDNPYSNFYRVEP